MHHDVLVLGGGSGGYATALRAAQLGKSVALIERDKLGGTCLHRGCIPTKALLHAAEIADAAREGSAFGVCSSLDGIDMEGVTAFQNGVVGRLYHGLQGLVRSAGVTLVAGEGRVVGPTSVEVDGTIWTGTDLVLATGSAARSLPGVDLGPRVVTSDQALTLAEVPRRVVVVGGSVIGVEFASVWRSFGAEVTVVETLGSLVPLEDVAVGRALERAFRKRGITCVTGTSLEGVKETSDEVAVRLSSGELITADLVLIAVGRHPVTAGLGLEEQGITTERGWVVTDDRLGTSIPHVYAVGDVVPGLQLAHRGFAHGIFVAEQIAGLDPEPVEDSGIPRVTYCNPEVASVGLTQAQAEEQYAGVDVFEYSLAGNGKSQILGTTGFVKIVREKDGPIVGVHLVGERMGEQIGEASLLVNWEAFPADAARFIHAHPTQNEALGEAALAMAGKPLHVHT
jgi:dihydrolipoamide dehydrogenase